MAEQVQREGPGASSRIAFPCNLANARECARELRSFLAAEQLSEEELFLCELCLVEACNNAVQNTRDAERDRPLFAEAICRPDLIELRVTDHTPGFDWPRRSSIPTPPAERGRGLFIIRSMMDEVAYHRGRGENIIVMRKLREELTPPQPREAAAGRRPDEVRAQLDECLKTISGMARELCFRSESLSAIFRCAAELGGTSDLETFVRRLLDDLLHLGAADWFVLRLIPPRGRELAVFARSSPTLGKDALALPEHPAGPGGGAELSAVFLRSPVRFDTREAGTEPEPLHTAGPPARGFVYPLLFGDTMVGTLAMGRSASQEPFSRLESEVMRAFSEFLAIQIVSLRQREEQVQSRLVNHELEIAHRIQCSLLPTSLPRLSGFELAGSWESARQVGGDFYDAISLSPHTLLLVVGDVMGKGVPAAMFATIMRGLVRALSSHGRRPAELLRHLNRVLYRDLSAVNMFMTAQIAFVDLRRRVLVSANAGHCPLIQIGNQGRPASPLKSAGTPLGVLPDVRYRQRTVRLARPCALLMHTDGLLEARSPAGDIFGAERLMEWLGRHCRPPGTAEEMRDRLAAEMRQFRGEAPMADDQAFLVLTETAPVARIRRVPARARNGERKRMGPVQALSA